MSKHVFTVAVELTNDDDHSTKSVLKQMAERITSNLTEEFGIGYYEDGLPLGHGGFEGPFVTKVEVAR